MAAGMIARTKQLELRCHTAGINMQVTSSAASQVQRQCAPSPKAGLPLVSRRGTLDGVGLRIIYNVQHFSVDVANWFTGQTTSGFVHTANNGGSSSDSGQSAKIVCR
jgi:hypothetical protein